MKTEDLSLLRGLIGEARVLSLGVLVDGRPHVGLLPFALQGGYGSALVHASALARHTRGLTDGAPFSVLIHAPETVDQDALQVPRVTLEGTVRELQRGTPEYLAGRDTYLARLPTSAPTFSLGDFGLYELGFERGRLVGGFARAATVTAEILDSLGGTA